MILEFFIKHIKTDKISMNQAENNGDTRKNRKENSGRLSNDYGKMPP